MIGLFLRFVKIYDDCNAVRHFVPVTFMSLTVLPWCERCGEVRRDAERCSYAFTEKCLETVACETEKCDFADNLLKRERSSLKKGEWY